MNHEIAYIRQAYKKHTLSNRALLHQFLKLAKFVWCDILHSMIQLLPLLHSYQDVKNLALFGLFTVISGDVKLLYAT